MPQASDREIDKALRVAKSYRSPAQTGGLRPLEGRVAKAVFGRAGGIFVKQREEDAWVAEVCHKAGMG